MREKLLPCPFCGGEAKLIKGLHSVDGDVYTLYGVSCLYGDSDQAALDGAYGVEHSIFGYFFEYQAIEAWNNRADARSRYAELFGTPERMARFIIERCGGDCIACPMPNDCPCRASYAADDDDYGPVLEWLRGDAE